MRLDGASEHITPYDRLAFSDVQAQALLASGEHRQELTAFFGEREYGELHYLARRAAKAGAQARAARACSLFPASWARNWVLSGRRRCQRICCGWIRWTSAQAGCAPCAWISRRARCGRWASCCSPTCGCGCSWSPTASMSIAWTMTGGSASASWASNWHNASRPSRTPYVHLVAHSMGGLVSRAALSLPARRKVQQLVLLGSPNEGSFAGVQAVRGTYAVVRKLARLDPRTSAEQLAEEVFNTFPSLYHLLPTPAHTQAIDLFDAQQWPHQGPASARRTAARGVGKSRAAELKPRRDVRWWSAPANPRSPALNASRMISCTR